MTIIEKINLISEEAKNQFKPDLKKYGKNFRAISESALLEVLNPLFKNYNIAYEVIIDKSELTLEKVNAGVDTSGNLVQRLVFIALIKVRLIFQSENESFITEGLGSGIDSGDKATGKALTGAVKYALSCNSVFEIWALKGRFSSKEKPQVLAKASSTIKPTLCLVF